MIRPNNKAISIVVRAHARPGIKDFHILPVAPGGGAIHAISALHAVREVNR
jgi:hypothetical protein